MTGIKNKTINQAHVAEASLRSRKISTMARNILSVIMAVTPMLIKLEAI